jgi:hypothetical protein
MFLVLLGLRMVNTTLMNQDEKKNNIFSQFDRLVKKFIPNFNVRAIIYLSVIFAFVIYIQIWRISPKPENTKLDEKPQETVIADQTYWESNEYKEKIQNQTVQSFTSEFQTWLDGKDQEFSRRRFEDILFINNGLTPMTGGDLTVIVPENFNYLENHARARYQYAKLHGFTSDTPTLVKLGNMVCDIDSKTEQVTDIELYDWRYTSMPKLAEFMKTKPDWKMQVEDRILDVSDPRIEDKNVLKLKTAQNQPAGLFSFLIFHNTKTNKIVLADSTILQKNGVDDKLTLNRISTKWDKQPKLYFSVGSEGCKQINNDPKLDYGEFD